MDVVITGAIAGRHIGAAGAVSEAEEAQVVVLEAAAAVSEAAGPAGAGKTVDS